MDDVQLVNSEMDVIGPASEHSPVTPTPRHNRRRTHSARSNDGDASRKKSAQKIQRAEEIPKGKEDDDAKGVTSENSAATPTPTRMRTHSSKRTDGDPNRQSSSQKRQPDAQSTKGNEDDDDVFQCQICNKTFTDFVQIKQHKIVCTRIKKKYVCLKCNKGFDQKAHFQQHFDY